MKNYKKLALTGVFGALIFLGTFILKAPIVYGYIHLGDGFVLLSAVLLGPIAALPAAFGSALADLAAGFGPYAPFSLLIKGLMALIVAVRYKGYTATAGGQLVRFSLAELLMVAGYFLADNLFWGIGGALAAVPLNFLQALAGVLVAYLGAKVIKRNKLSL
ncbi:MAG: ECF transporter S component [Clostridiaceae bacterium]|nr:ECF transporter S component [Clostridiaceae bacterium]